MHIAFLIGNGFDLRVGLNTKYSEFVEYYVNPIDFESVGVIEEFKERIRNDLRENSLKNDSQFEDKWANCELQKGRDTLQFDLIQEYYDCWDDFFNGLVDYLKIEESRVDFSYDPDGVASEFLRSIANFSSCLSSREVDELNKIRDKYSHEQIFYDFLIFNYTSVFDQCVSLAKESEDKSAIIRSYSGRRIQDQIGRVCHPHGSLENGNIIFGVNDENQISNKVFLEDPDFKIDCIKTAANYDCGAYQEDEAKRIIEASSIVYVFGMSIGETDDLWWGCLGRWLQESTNRMLIIHSFSIVPNTQPRQRASKRREMRDWFFTRAGIDEEGAKEALSSRILIDFNPDIFSLDFSLRLTGRTEAP